MVLHGLSEIGVDAPVADLVGVSQRVARDPAPESHVVELGRPGTKIGLYVAKALPIGQQGEGQAEELGQTGEAFHFVMAAIAGHAFSELGKQQEIHDLGKDGGNQ